jgi:TRAP-type C4-dicarboxylate transport system permease small subunit
MGRRWLGWLAWVAGNVEEIAGVTFFLVMVGSVSIGVLFRYGLSRPLIWTEEISNFCFLWAVFLGAAAVAKRREHIAVDTLVALLPAPLQRAVGVLTSLLVAAMLATITVLGVLFALSQRNTTTEALEMQVVWWALAVPVSCGLACFYAVRDLVRQARGTIAARAAVREAALSGPVGEERISG